jgi:biotin carboxyl carrier protein
MKMEIPVVATEPGVVAEVLVAEGDQVAENDVLVRLES